MRPRLSVPEENRKYETTKTMKLKKATLQQCSIPGGSGGLKYRIERLTNAAMLSIPTVLPSGTVRHRDVNVGSFLSETEVESLCRGDVVEVTILAPKA